MGVGVVYTVGSAGDDQTVASECTCLEFDVTGEGRARALLKLRLMNFILCAGLTD